MVVIKFIDMLEDSLIVKNPSINKTAYEKYADACDLAREMVSAKTGKFSKVGIDEIDDPLEMHKITVTIDDDTDFDGNEVENLIKFLDHFDYIVFEEAPKGKTQIACCVDNIYTQREP